MIEKRPVPMISADTDLRSFSFMPLDVVRLRDSEIAAAASGDAFRAAVLLWCAAWHQIPAASLPNDENALARYAGYGRDMKGWRKVREQALHGFIECSDGRLYHPVVAEKALEAFDKKRKNKNRTGAATAARREAKSNGGDTRNDIRNDQRNGPIHGQRNGPIYDTRHDDRAPIATLDVATNVTATKDRTGQERDRDTTGQETKSTTPPSEFGAARASTGTAAGGLVREDAIKKGQSEFDALSAALHAAIPEEVTWPIKAKEDIASIYGLIEQGASLEIDVLPAIRAECKRLLANPPHAFKGIEKWSYFAKVARGHWERRLSAGADRPAAATIVPPTSTPISEEQWAQIWADRLRVHQFDASKWQRVAYGPPPDEYNCQAGRKLCNQYGFFTVDEWRAMLSRFRDDSEWPREAGPDPTEPGTRVPMMFLHEFGFIDAGAEVEKARARAAGKTKDEIDQKHTEDAA